MQQELETIVWQDISRIMGAVLESKDTYVLNHSVKVGKMAYKLGIKLGLSEEELKIVYMAGYLHDIGKVGIQDKILKKSGKLDKNEWEIMKTHSEIGYKILNSIKCFRHISDIVLHNHEKWNGTGYPDELKGEEIPFMSRIISVCDSIDAMTSDRLYGIKMTDSECQEELIKNKEIMYDSNIVDCVVENWSYVVARI